MYKQDKSFFMFFMFFMFILQETPIYLIQIILFLHALGMQIFAA